jgi:hypothetical protein
MNQRKSIHTYSLKLMHLLLYKTEMKLPVTLRRSQEVLALFPHFPVPMDNHKTDLQVYEI